MASCVPISPLCANHPLAQRLIEEYLAARGKHGGGQDGLKLDGPLFRPVWQTTARALWISISTPIYRNMVIKYAQGSGISAEAVGYACIRCVRLQRLMRHPITRVLPRCVSGSGTPMSPLPASTTGVTASKRKPDISRKVLKTQTRSRPLPSRINRRIR